MKDSISQAVARAKNFQEVEQLLNDLFSSLRKAGSVQRVGVVAGVIASDGPEYIEQNVRRLETFTDYIRGRHPFPIFSATDIFTQETFSQLERTREKEKKYREFWENIIRSGYVTDLFLTPRWDKSHNAQKKFQLAQIQGIRIHYWDIFDLYPTYRS